MTNFFNFLNGLTKKMFFVVKDYLNKAAKVFFIENWDTSTDSNFSSLKQNTETSDFRDKSDYLYLSNLDGIHPLKIPFLEKKSFDVLNDIKKKSIQTDFLFESSLKQTFLEFLTKIKKMEHLSAFFLIPKNKKILLNFLIKRNYSISKNRVMKLKIQVIEILNQKLTKSGIVINYEFEYKCVNFFIFSTQRILKKIILMLSKNKTPEDFEKSLCDLKRNTFKNLARFYFSGQMTDYETKNKNMWVVVYNFELKKNQNYSLSEN